MEGPRRWGCVGLRGGEVEGRGGGQVGAGPGEGIKKRGVLTTLSSDLLCKDRRIRPIP